ncbi:MAG: hypothetical protein RR185_03310 [Angelakisella sp.]
MKTKRMLTLLLVIAMVLGILSGCGSQPAPSASVPAAPTTQPAASEAEKPKFATPSWKTDTSPCNIQWFFGYDWYGSKFTPETNLFHKWITDETGCTIEIQTGDVDKLNVLISTNSLPDVVTYDANSTQRTLLEDNGKLLPLNKLREEYAPDMIVPESMMDWYTAKDGNWYAYTNFYYGDDNVPANKGFYETHNQNFARKDILDQIGMKADDMRTKEGFVKALRAVKEKGITYGGQKMIPYMALFADRADEQMAEQFGASMETKEGKYQSIYRAPEYLEGLQFFNQLYREGLMTDESFTAKKDQVEQKVASGQLFATTRWTNVSSVRGTLYAADNKALMLYCGDMKGDTHDKVAVQGNNNAGWAATMITSNAKQPGRIAQLFAFMTQKEYYLNNVWAMDGYTVENNQVVRKQEFIDMQMNNPKEYSAKYDGFDWVCDYTIIQGTWPKASTVFDEDSELKTHDKNVIIFDDKCFSATSPEAGSEIASIDVRIKEYMAQALGRIVTAPTADDCKKLYTETMGELENLGLSKLEAYKDTKFQANKTKLGIKFAHPFNKK